MAEEKPMVTLEEAQRMADDARTQALTAVYNRVNGMMEPNPKGPAEKGWNDACKAMREAILSLRTS